MNPFVTIIAGLAAGAVAAWWLDTALLQRRLPEPLSDAQLRDRIQERLAGLVTYPDAVGVTVQAGLVRVSGKVLARERDLLLMRLKDFPGVHRIHNALTTFDDAGRRGGLMHAGPAPGP